MPRYSATVMEHFSEPRHFGGMQGAHLVGVAGVAGVPGRGRFLVVYLRLSRDERPKSRAGGQQEAGEQRIRGGQRIVEAMFHCHGCGATITCGSMLTEMITGKLIQDCRHLTQLR